MKLRQLVGKTNHNQLLVETHETLYIVKKSDLVEIYPGFLVPTNSGETPSASLNNL